MTKINFDPAQPPSLYLFFNMAFDAGWNQEYFEEFWAMYSKTPEFLNALEKHLKQNGRNNSNVVSGSMIVAGGDFHIGNK